ncbi:MAG: NUDIX domain-containing protein [Pseudomonadota bacterium]
MSGPLVLDAEWLKALRAGAIVPPLRPRVPLWAGQSVIGSVEADFLGKIALHELMDDAHALIKAEHPAALGWRLMGDVTISLGQLARAIHDAGMAAEWRSEQLAVHDQFGHLKGTVERAVVRVLGIATMAVHLVGRSPDGRYWVQQRAFTKSNDPGLWDTLMGGMVSATDKVDAALARETWEEAGLKVSELQDVRHGGQITTRRPAADGGGCGFVIEDIDWYTCTVPDGMSPENQDGEVEQFRLMDAAELVAALQRGEFTTEAALILAAALGS